MTSVMLVGRSGSGKTRVTETLTGSEVKKPRDIQSFSRFEAEFRTKETYGFFSNERDLQTCIKDLEMCVNSFPGIDIICFVIRIGRFTPEEKDMINILRDTLGEMAFNFTIVIFTNLDSLIYDDVPLSEFLEESPQELQDLLRLCGGRYVGFDNTGSEEDKQGYARSLIEAMKALQEQNESAKYTAGMFDEARAAKLVRDEEKKKVEEDNIRLLKAQMKHDIHTEVEAKIRRELDERQIAKKIVPRWDNQKRQLGGWNRGRRELDDKGYPEDMPYTKQQGKRQPENISQVRSQPEDMLYSKEQDRGQPDDMKLSKEQDIRSAIKSRRIKNKPEVKPKPAHLNARGKDKNKRPSEQRNETGGTTTRNSLPRRLYETVAQAWRSVTART